MSSPPPFQDLRPSRLVWVSANAGSGGDGSAQRPFNTIQAGVNAATAGTAVMVKAGVYDENVKLPGSGGQPGAPIWLVSADGPQAAEIAGSDLAPGIQGLGTDNYVIKNFLITGTYDGIQFSQSGRDFSNLVANVVIQGNSIQDVLHDGVKVGQADNVWILDNRIENVRDEEGIDTLAVTNSVIARNTVSGAGSSAAAIFTKGGAFNVLIEGNDVSGAAGDGISIGGNTEAQYFKPGYTGFEAKNVTVVGNRVADVGKQPLSVRGATGSEVHGNAFDATGGNGVGVYVTRGNPDAATIAYSKDNVITDNVLSGAKWPLRVDAGNSTDLVFERNAAGAWSQPVGPQPVTLWAAATYNGTSANDSISGTAGADTLAGGAGSDTYVINDPGDRVIEAAGAGTDTVRVSVSYTMTDNIEVLMATGSSRLTATGNDLANRMSAGGAGSLFRGEAGSDTLEGGAGADTLEGGSGKDQLWGGPGADRLSGGAGQDSFVFRALTDFAAGDVITDLNPADYDRIDLRTIDASNQTSGDQAFRFIGAAPFSGHEAELRAQAAGADLVVQGDVNGDGKADFALRLLNLAKIPTNGFLL